MNAEPMAPGMRAVGVQRLWETDLPAGSSGLAWLGQAGFALRFGDCRLLIDPYLSDFLAQKYRGTEFPHTRLMPAPVEPGQFQGVDWVFCTHRHSDHMDPVSLPLLAISNPSCRFVVPRAEREAALKAGVPAERVVAVNAGESLSLSEDVTVNVIAAAHEGLKVNECGDHHFLGFIFRAPLWGIYHSGDCVPYEGLVEELLRHKIDVALLPVNGRDVCRSSRGIAGNFTFAEARTICADAHIPCLVPHHFGMFAFNTPSLAELKREVGRAALGGCCVLPTVESYYLLERGHLGSSSVAEF
jgi:L-ascorbate metabolism protein UlaG (beta-lactamase superfamily)